MSTRYKNESVKSGGGNGVGVWLAVMVLLWAGAVSASPEPAPLVMTEAQPVVVEKSGPAITLDNQAVISEAVSPAHDIGAKIDPGVAEPIDQATAITDETVADAQGQSVAYMSAAADTDQYAAPARVRQPPKSAETAPSLVAATVDQDGPALPYALVLALIALIGLVPVSRRNNY